MLVCSLRSGVSYCSPQLLRSRADKEPSACLGFFYCCLQYCCLQCDPLPCNYTCETFYSKFLKNSRLNFLHLVFFRLTKNEPQYSVSRFLPIFLHLLHVWISSLSSSLPWAYFISMHVRGAIFGSHPVLPELPRGECCLHSYFLVLIVVSNLKLRIFLIWLFF